MPYWIPLTFVVVLGAMTINTRQRALRITTMILMVLGVIVGGLMAWVDTFVRQLDHELAVCFGNLMRSPDMVRRAPGIDQAGLNFYAPLVLGGIILVLIFTHINVMMGRRGDPPPPEYEKQKQNEEEFPPYHL